VSGSGRRFKSGVAIDISHVLGTSGTEVIGASSRKQIEVP
jgi:hypothetical protein